MHLLPLEDFPEPFQDFGTFALPDIDDGTTFQVKYDGQVAMAFANADFIDGDLLKFMEPGEAKRLIRFRFRISLMTVKALRFSKIVLEVLFLIAYHLNGFR
nr:hypothetical protein [Desulfobacca acetoxidans]